jgi:hypothetical protein
MFDYFGEVFCALPRCTGRRLTSVAKTDRVHFTGGSKKIRQ